jgi:hypothetical protein
MKPNRKCLECGDTLRGRADQKYCSDQCRNTFNNRLMGETNNLVRQINRILRKNQNILADLSSSGKTTFLKSDLIERGFNFSYLTNSRITHNGRMLFFCYGHGYAVDEDDKILLVQKQENED